MQKMILIDGKEEIDGYEFLHFTLSSEFIDGHMALYTTVICRDEEGYLEEHPISKVRFV